jgi:protein tyrosine phosphatase (PTP) superfamily phosphohydrolase (DUF442 family)
MRSRGLRIAASAAVAALLATTVLAQPPAERNPPTLGIPNATFPLPGILASGQPTGEQIQLAAEEGGYRTVIDLRAADEPRGFDEPEAARQIGLAYVNIPVTLATLDQTTVDRFLDALRKAQRPVLLHCSTSNRVGALLYAWMVLERKESPARALEKAKAAGLRDPELTEKVRKLVAERSSPERPRSKVEAGEPSPSAHLNRQIPREHGERHPISP